MSDNTTAYLEYAGNLAKWTLSEGQNLMYFLNVMSRFPDLSVNNQLLIMGYKPEAQYIRSLEEWVQLGIDIKPEGQVIPIITPDGNDGFYIQQEIDASDTTYEYHAAYPDKMYALEALLVGHTDSIDVVNSIKGTSGRAMYHHQTRRISVVRGSDVAIDEFFTALAAEFVHQGIAAGKENAYPRAANQLTAISTAYVLGIRYGMDVGNIHLEKLPAKYPEMSPKAAKKALDEISQNVKTLDGNINAALTKIIQREMQIQRRDELERS